MIADSDTPVQMPAKRTVPVEENLDESGIWAFESQHGDAFQMDLTHHRFLKLLLITAGAGAIVGDWGSPVCKKGDLVIIPAGVRHKIVDTHRQPISLYGLGIAPQCFRPVAMATDMIPSGILPAQQLGPLRLENRLRRLLYTHRQSSPLYRLASVAAALDLVAQVTLAVRSDAVRSDSASGHAFEQGLDVDEPLATMPVTAVPAIESDPMIETYLTWLQHNFFEPQTLADAARTCGMSRRAFTTAFRNRTGRTWLDHLHRLRIQHAIGLLATTDRKMASIAFQCGFEDLSTFYRVMHRITGNRPGAYRQRESPATTSGSPAPHAPPAAPRCCASEPDPR